MPSIANPYNQQETDQTRPRNDAIVDTWIDLTNHQDRIWADSYSVWGSKIWDPPALTQSDTLTRTNSREGEDDINRSSLGGTPRRETSGKNAYLFVQAEAHDCELEAHFVNQETGESLATPTLLFSDTATQFNRAAIKIPWWNIASHVRIPQDYGDGRERGEFIEVWFKFARRTNEAELHWVAAGEVQIRADTEVRQNPTEIWTPRVLENLYGGRWLNIRQPRRVYQTTSKNTNVSSDGDPVGAVEGGFGNDDWVQPDSGQRPEWDTDNTLAGYPTLRFPDRTSVDYLRLSSSLAEQSDYTAFCIVRMDSWGNAVREEWFMHDNPVSPGTPIDWGVDADADHSHWRGPAAGQVVQGTNFSGKSSRTLTSAQWAMVTIQQERIDSTTVNVDLYLERELDGSGSGDWENMSEDIGWGGAIASELNNRPMQGNIAEGLVIFTALNATQRQNVWKYLTWKWFGGAPPAV